MIILIFIYIIILSFFIRRIDIISKIYFTIIFIIILTSYSINTTDFKEGIIDNEETPKSSPNRFFSFFNIENKWSSNKDSKFIAGKDINEMQANLNKEIEDLDQP